LVTYLPSAAPRAFVRHEHGDHGSFYDIACMRREAVLPVVEITPEAAFDLAKSTNYISLELF
jgi:hypothetical protein